MEVKDRYVTFNNIDCYENAALVLDAMNELFELKPESKNGLWINFMDKIPEELVAEDIGLGWQM